MIVDISWLKKSESTRETARAMTSLEKGELVGLRMFTTDVLEDKDLNEFFRRVRYSLFFCVLHVPSGERCSYRFKAPLASRREIRGELAKS